MSKTAPGKSHRRGLSLIELFEMFPTDAIAEKWFAQVRWPRGPYCPQCKSKNVQFGIKHHSMTHRCRDCKDKKDVLTENRHADGRLQARLSGMGHCHLLINHEPKGRFQHEAAPGS